MNKQYWAIKNNDGLVQPYKTYYAGDECFSLIKPDDIFDTFDEARAAYINREHKQIEKLLQSVTTRTATLRMYIEGLV